MGSRWVLQRKIKTASSPTHSIPTSCRRLLFSLVSLLLTYWLTCFQKYVCDGIARIVRMFMFGLVGLGLFFVFVFCFLLVCLFSSLFLCFVAGLKPSMCKAFKQCWMDGWNFDYIRSHLFPIYLESSPSSWFGFFLGGGRRQGLGLLVWLFVCFFLIRLYVKEAFSKPDFLSS